MALMKTLNGYEVCDQVARDSATTAQNTANGLVNRIYPVGSIYISMSLTSPASLFGGTWQQIEGRFLYAIGTNYGNSKLYGGTNELNLVAGVGAGNSLDYSIGYAADGRTTSMNASGHNFTYLLKAEKMLVAPVPSHSTIVYPKDNCRKDPNSTGWNATTINNMPQYITCYMWFRTA